jgi:hypothetical protein
MPSSIIDSLSRISYLYHFTDSRNIPSIREAGGLYSTAKLREIGRDAFFGGGNKWSLDADKASGMDQYVHLCLKTQHPMQFRATQEGRIQATSWLYVNASILKQPGVLFCPGVANKSKMPTFSIEEADAMVDFEVLYTQTNWNDPEINARLQVARKCEILVPDHIPFEYLEFFPNG